MLEIDINSLDLMKHLYLCELSPASHVLDCTLCTEESATAAVKTAISFVSLTQAIWNDISSFCFLTFFLTFYVLLSSSTKLCLV